MTARIRRPANRTPPELLQKQLIAYVREHGECRATALVRVLQCARATVLKHAKEVEANGLLHHIVVNRAGSNGAEYLFRAGPAPIAERAPDCFDSRPVVKTWTPMRAVDPWMLPREFFGSSQAAA